MRQTNRKDLIEQLIPIVRKTEDVIMAIYRRESSEVDYKVDASPLTEADFAAQYLNN